MDIRKLEPILDFIVNGDVEPENKRYGFILVRFEFKKDEGKTQCDLCSLGAGPLDIAGIFTEIAESILEQHEG